MAVKKAATDLSIQKTDLENMLKDIRKKGFLATYDAGALLQVLGQSGQRTSTYEEDKALLITLAQKYIKNDSDNTKGKANLEILLAAFGLLEGYSEYPKVSERRGKYYTNGFPEGKYTNPQSTLQKVEDAQIRWLTKCILAENDIATVIASAPKHLDLPLPQYPEKYEKNDTGDPAFNPNQLMALIKESMPKNQFQEIPPACYSPVYPLGNLIDRQEIINRLNDKLWEETAPVYLHAAIGGLGKTEIAKAYCNGQYAKQFSYIFWVTASSADIRETIINDPIFRFARNTEEVSVESEFRRFVGQAKALTGEILLVIDNVTSVEQLEHIECDDSIPLLKWRTLVTTRAVLEDSLFMKRVVSLDRLDESYCEALFYQHYAFPDKSDEMKDSNQEVLCDLLKELDYHTLMVVLIAKIGSTKQYSVSELEAFVRERGIIHENLQVKVSAQIRNQRSRGSAVELISALFDWAALSEVEQYILKCFSMLPNRPISEEILLSWMENDMFNKRLLTDEFRSLHENGWLLMEKNLSLGSVSFWCHHLIQTAAQSRKTAAQHTERFIRNITDFFHVSPLEERRTELLQYTDCADTVLENAPHLIKEVFDLRKNYVELLNHYEYKPDIAYRNAVCLKDYYKRIFSQTDTLEWMAGWADVQLLYSVSYINFSNERGAYAFLEKMRQDIFDQIRTVLPETHLIYVRSERLLALAKRSNGKPAESASILEKLVARVETIIADNQQTNDAWKYIYMIALASLGIAYNRLSGVAGEKGVELQKKYLFLALDLREKYLQFSLSVLPETHDLLRRPYNDLGKTYLHLYDITPNPDYLDKAEYYLMKKHEIVSANFDPDSAVFASALDGLSMLRERQGKFCEAMTLANSVLDNKKQRFRDENYKSVMLSYKQIGILNHKIYLQSKSAQNLHDALRNAERAVKIGEHLYDGDTENIFYREVLALRDKIMKSLEHENGEGSKKINDVSI